MPRWFGAFALALVVLVLAGFSGTDSTPRAAAASATTIDWWQRISWNRTDARRQWKRWCRGVLRLRWERCR